MSLLLQLKPEIETALREEAGRRGMEPEQFVTDLLESRLRGSEAPLVLNDHAAWLRELQAWIDSHDASVPPLSEEAVSRASFYEERL